MHAIIPWREFLSLPKIPKRLLKSKMVEKSSHLSMEELFAHNLRSEDKGLKKQMGTAAAFVVYWEIKTEQQCEECLYTAWQIAYMGFKASSRKIRRDNFSKKKVKKIKTARK